MTREVIKEDIFRIESKISDLVIAMIQDGHDLHKESSPLIFHASWREAALHNKQMFAERSREIR